MFTMTKFGDCHVIILNSFCPLGPSQHYLLRCLYQAYSQIMGQSWRLLNVTEMTGCYNVHKLGESFSDDFASAIPYICEPPEYPPTPEHRVRRRRWGSASRLNTPPPPPPPLPKASSWLATYVGHLIGGKRILKR